MAASNAKRPAGAAPDEITRLCPRCQSIVRRKDEQRGKCPTCGARLLSLAFEEAFVRQEEKQ